MNRPVQFIKTAIVLAGCALALSCGNNRKAPEGELQGEISLSGAFALYPLAVKWADEFRKLHPYVKIDISAGGAGKGMTDALAQVVDLGMVSRDVYDSEVAKGALAFAVAKDAVVATINADNPVLEKLLETGLTQQNAVRLWITEDITIWGQLTGTPDDTPVHVYTRSDACGAAETWAQWLGATQEDLGGTAVFGDPGVAMAVQKDKLAIGLNNLSYAYDENTRLPNPGIVVMPIDVDGNGRVDDYERFYATKDDIIEAIANDRYPSPPARDLYLVSNGVPQNPVVIEFLRFILTEGQQYNVPSGFIGLSQDKLDAGLALLPAEALSVEPVEEEETAE